MEKRDSFRRKSGALANLSHAASTLSSSSRQISLQSNNHNMTNAEFLRIHSNASPAKLRDIVKNKIFVADDVEYLKRLVNDIGMDYVFRFLWYDGCPSASLSSRWKDSSGEASKQESVGEKGSSTRESNASSISGGSSPFLKYQESIIRRGRTWVEYCCFYNAHKCLLWIFREIILHYRQQKNQLQMLKRKQKSENSDSDVEYLAEADGIDEEDNLCDVEIIRRLLESPSATYCGTNYVAVGEHEIPLKCVLPYIIVENNQSNYCFHFACLNFSFTSEFLSMPVLASSSWWNKSKYGNKFTRGNCCTFILLEGQC